MHVMKDGYWLAGFQLASYVRKNQDAVPSTTALKAAIADFLLEDQTYVVAIRDTIDSPAFMALIKMASTGAGYAQRDSLIVDAKKKFSKDSVRALSSFLDGFLGIDYQAHHDAGKAPAPVLSPINRALHPLALIASLPPKKRAARIVLAALALLGIPVFFHHLFYPLDCILQPGRCLSAADARKRPNQSSDALSLEGRKASRLEGKSNFFPGQGSTLTKISGNVSYPGEEIPRLEICATETTSKKKVCSVYAANETNYIYEISVPPGRYWISAENIDYPVMKLWNAMCVSNICTNRLVVPHVAYAGLAEIKGADLKFWGNNVVFDNHVFEKRRSEKPFVSSWRK